MVASQTKIYQLGGGALSIKLDGSSYDDYRYLGNTNSIVTSSSIETLPHMNNDDKLAFQDDIAYLEILRTGSLVVDAMYLENIGLFMLNSTPTHAAQGGTGTVAVPEQFVVRDGGQIKLAYKFVSAITAIQTNPGAVALVEGTDYEWKTNGKNAGVISLIAGGANYADGDTIDVTYTYDHTTLVTKITSDVDSVLKAHFMYRPAVAKGPDLMFEGYYAMTPSGDFQMKSMTEWNSMTFDLSFIKHANYGGLLDITYLGEV